jgi:uncharacterized protein YeaO (DUF488 family)
MPILTQKHCRNTPTPADGFRLLVMRFWPRGVHKAAFHASLSALAPSAALLRDFKAYRLSGQPPQAELTLWDRYRLEMQAHRPEIEALRQRHLSGETITLLCACHDPGICHRTALKRYILDPDLLDKPLC